MAACDTNLLETMAQAPYLTLHTTVGRLQHVTEGKRSLSGSWYFRMASLSS